MKKEIPPKRLALLKALGFDIAPGSTLTHDAFCCPTCTLDTKMLVQGDHATDRAYIYYACVRTDEGELDGLFYAPSMLEYLLTDYQGEWSFSRMLKEINAQSDCKLSLVDVGGYPMLFTDIHEIDWQEKDLRFQISDMLKLIGQLDYLLSRKWKSLLAKGRRGNP